MSDNLCSYILFDGGGLPLAAAPAPSLSYLHLSIRWAGSSATPSAGSSPQRPQPQSTNRCQPREGGVLLLFVEEDSPAERHADESQHRMSPLEKNVPNGNMFATRSDLHTHTFTSFECSLCKSPLSAKKHERGSVRGCYCWVRVQRGNCSALVTFSPFLIEDNSN